MPSRRGLLAAVGGSLGAGVLGGYVAGTRPFRDRSASVVPLATTPTAWSFVDHDRARSRHPPPESAPAETPRERWRHVLGGADRPDRATAPVVANGTVLLPVTVRGREARRFEVRALDRASGDRAWRWRLPDAEGPRRTSLAAAGDSVFLTTNRGDRNLVALAAATGDERWHWVPEGGTVSGPPVAAAGLLVVMRSAGEGLVAIHPRTGEPRWTWEGDASTLSHAPAFDGERLVVTGSDSLFALDPRTGTERWRAPEEGNFAWPPALADGRAFLGTTGGELAAHDATTGDRLWKRRLTGPVPCGDGEGRECARWFDAGAVTGDALVVREGRVDDAPDVLHAREPADGARRWTAEPALPGDASFTRPVVVDGRVYVGSASPGGEGPRGRLAAFDLGSGERVLDRSLDAGVVGLVVTDGWLLAVTRDALVAFR